MANAIRLDKIVRTECNLPPDIHSAPRPCECDDTVKTCPPITRAEDAIIIRRTEVERKIKLMVDCDEELVPCKKMKLTLRRRGECDVVSTVIPWHADCDNYVYFDWDDASPSFNTLEPGQYEADVWFDCEVVQVLLLVIDQMWVGVRHARPKYRQDCTETCAPPTPCRTNNKCCGEVPEVTGSCDTTEESETNCNTCGESQC